MTTSWSFQCPNCQCPLQEVKNESGELNFTPCSCGHRIESSSTIADFLKASRRQYFDKFLKSYMAIRKAEGRASMTQEEFKKLPEIASSDPLAWQWNIRQKSYKALSKLLLNQAPSAAKILDLGAGNGWLSHKLLGLGFNPLAIDVNIDEFDGLKALVNFKIPIPAIRSEFDNLPLTGATADVVIFNASFHYAANATATLSESLRVLKPGGMIIIMDSPIYHKPSSGDEMIADLHDDFEEKYNDRSDHLDRIGYLTYDSLNILADQLNFKWNVISPWYGWRWALKPILAKFRGKREPAQFSLYYIKKEKSS